MNDYTFGNYLYQLRIDKELSQFQLGSLLGVSDKAVSKWENGSSKPKIEILIKMSDIFNVSVDDLLSIKRNNCFKDNYFTNKSLWASIYDNITTKYGDTPPYIIYNRYLSEYYAFMTTNHEAISYLRLLKDLKRELNDRGEYFIAEGFINSLFIPYIMGITFINPLPPHYYCPNCKKVEFHEELYTCWDLTEKKCSCGHSFSREGHNIPYETADQNINSNSNHYKILVSKKNLDIVIDFIRASSKEKMSVVHNEHSAYSTVLVNDRNIETNKDLIRKPHTTTISIRTSKIANTLASIENETGDKVENIQYDHKCLEYILKHPKNERVKKLIEEVNPQNFTDFIKCESIIRTDGVWECGKKYISKYGINNNQILAYREDIFDYITRRSNTKDTGFAREVMYRVSRGRFVNGIPNNILYNLNEINADQWFLDAIQEIKFLNTKCYGVSEAQFELSYAWYNIHYPETAKSIFE